MRNANIVDYLFENTESGDEFFVECASLNEAWAIINKEYDGCYERQFIEYKNTWVTVEEADMWGLDTL